MNYSEMILTLHYVINTFLINTPVVYLVIMSNNKWLIHVNKCLIMNQLLTQTIHSRNKK